ncbi:MAG: NAD(P)H-hydrate dehydratase [Patescibacteria group bacterium]|nr:NAD(P)H-hydrate dehydratase [Patescibacteria group bacterium]
MTDIIYQNKLLYPEVLWERPVNYYKSKAGRILLVAGSKGLAGAALLIAEAAFRSGTGILTLAFPEELKGNYTEILPEAMTLPLPQTHSGSIARAALPTLTEQLEVSDVLVVGPGISENTETIQTIWELLRVTKIPTVIDAEGIRALAHGIEAVREKEGMEKVHSLFRGLGADIVITPHPGEAAKLMHALGEEVKKSKPNYIEKNKVEVARILTSHLSACIVLKGHDTTITSKKGKVVVDKVGGPELATAGTGDVLAGIIGSFIAQNPKKIFKAAVTAVYLHSLSGRLAKEVTSERSVMASDVIKYLPKAIKESE